MAHPDRYLNFSLVPQTPDYAFSDANHAKSKTQYVGKRTIVNPYAGQSEKYYSRPRTLTDSNYPPNTVAKQPVYQQSGPGMPHLMLASLVALGAVVLVQ